MGALTGESVDKSHLMERRCCTDTLPFGARFSGIEWNHRKTDY